MALYWCLLPFELAFTWLDVTRQRAVPGSSRRLRATRRELGLVPGVAAQYAVAFAAALALVARYHRLEPAQQVLGLVCSVLLLASAWQDVRRIGDAWRERRAVPVVHSSRVVCQTTETRTVSSPWSSRSSTV